MTLTVEPCQQSPVSAPLTSPTPSTTAPALSTPSVSPLPTALPTAATHSLGLDASLSSRTVSPSSNKEKSSDVAAVGVVPLTPVTMTHFQQTDNGTLEKKTVPESVHNPFRNSPMPALRATPSKNPFVMESTLSPHQPQQQYHNSSNPFLLRVASPLMSRTNTKSPTTEPGPAVDSVQPVCSAVFHFTHILFLCPQELFDAPFL